MEDKNWHLGCLLASTRFTFLSLPTSLFPLPPSPLFLSLSPSPSSPTHIQNTSVWGQFQSDTKEKDTVFIGVGKASGLIYESHLPKLLLATTVSQTLLAFVGCDNLSSAGRIFCRMNFFWSLSSFSWGKEQDYLWVRGKATVTDEVLPGV